MRDGFKDREHLFRVAALFLLGTAAFFLLRAFMVPTDFGLYGPYRASALDDARAQAISFAGQKACVECHADVDEARKAARHVSLSCESCHGPLARHASGEDQRKPTRPDGRRTCLICHTANKSKPKVFPQILIADHAPEGACIECHQQHAPKIS
jgi:hypothetical protein